MRDLVLVQPEDEPHGRSQEFLKGYDAGYQQARQEIKIKADMKWLWVEVILGVVCFSWGIFFGLMFAHPVC
jgi:hypothetical protein